MTLETQKVLFLFPGQGSQYRGIGSDLYEQHELVKNTYATASDILGYDMAELSFKDPREQLNLTRFTQPALLTHSYACLQLFRQQTDDRIKPDAAAGHSLGEYSALVAADSLSFEEALKLVQTRGELMGKYGEGEMSAFPLELDSLRPLADQFFCGIAGCNLQDQTVVGGRAADLDQLADSIAEQFPRKKPVRLKTEGAFHTYYMVAAAMHFRTVLDQVTIRKPAIQVLSNYSGEFHEHDSDAIKSKLFLQLFHPVMWYKNLQTAHGAGLNCFYEFGGGIGKGELPEEKRANLEGIVKRAFRRAENPPDYRAVINRETLENAVSA